MVSVFYQLIPKRGTIYVPQNKNGSIKVVQILYRVFKRNIFYFVGRLLAVREDDWYLWYSICDLRLDIFVRILYLFIYVFISSPHSLIWGWHASALGKEKKGKKKGKMRISVFLYLLGSWHTVSRNSGINERYNKGEVRALAFQGLGASPGKTPPQNLSLYYCHTWSVLS